MNTIHPSIGNSLRYGVIKETPETVFEDTETIIHPSIENSFRYGVSKRNNENCT